MEIQWETIFRIIDVNYIHLFISRLRKHAKYQNYPNYSN